MSKIIRNTATNILSIILSLLFMLAMAAGVGAAKPPANQAPRDPAQYEAWLANQVRHKLVMLPWYSLFDNLEYRVDGTKVTLSGQVVRPVLKDDAGAAVKKIEGVTEVNNQIEVLPPSPFDFRIRREELRAIYSYAPLQRYGVQPIPSIHIIVKNGNVTLEGVVANETDKNLAYVRADAVPGVFSVTNNLRVEKKG